MNMLSSERFDSANAPSPRASWAQFNLDLLRAQTIREVGVCVVGFATEFLSCRQAVLVWSQAAAADGATRSFPDRVLSPSEIELKEQALSSNATLLRPGDDASETLVAMPLLRASAPPQAFVVLLASARSEPLQRLLNSTVWARFMERIRARAASALESERLRQDVERLEVAERLQRALYAIGDLAFSDLDTPEVLRGIHAIVGRLMYAENFFLVLYNETRQTLRFAYFVDSVDPDVPDPADEVPLSELTNSLTVAALRSGVALMGPSEQLCARFGLASEPAYGPECVDWLGVPLHAGNQVRGLVVVQSYDPGIRFNEHDRALLSYVAQHILPVVERKQAQVELEQKVAARTQELVAEVRERQRGEKLQAALFRIADLASTSKSLDDFYAAVHGIVGGLLYAKNFFIALLSKDGNTLDFPYAADEEDDEFLSGPVGHGLTAYVLRLGKPLLVNHDEVDALVAAGEIQRLGPASVCWLGVPLIRDAHAYGVLVVQSYTPGVVYHRADQDLLTFVAVHIGNALDRRKAQDALHRANLELSRALQHLTQTQRQLVDAEKMAALGQLVAGVAHEVNTPLGVAITASSSLEDETHRVKDELSATRLTRRDLNVYLSHTEEGTRIIHRNLDRAAELVRTFKQVSVDRTSDGRRVFLLDEFLAELLSSLALLWKHRAVRLEITCPGSIEFDSFPGALGQVITNLAQNALLHAFDAGVAGLMRIAVQAPVAGEVEIRFADDGKGIEPAHLDRIFEPFFTTKRNQGGTGLGLNIVFNLVKEKLGGRITVNSVPDEGTEFVLNLPRVAPC